MRPPPALAGSLLAGTLLLAGCGGGDAGGDSAGDSGSGDTATPSTPAATTGPDGGTAAQGGIELTVAVDLAGDGEVTTWTLRCDPPAGDHPDPVGACAQLSALGTGAFDPPAADAVCTQLYGGPQTARVSGTVAGEPVDAQFSRTDGCAIARWDRLAPIVPVAQ